MEKMRELYQKVNGNEALRSKFAEIINNAQEAGSTETANKLLAFAKDVGYDISIAEMQEFFKEMEESRNGELDENGLDQVAGGKGDWIFIFG